MSNIMKSVFGQKGISAVEFAIILPLLVVFIFGIIEFGLLLFNKQVITNASREGARAGIVQQNPRVDEATIISVVNNYCANHLVTFGSPTSPAITTTAPCGGFGEDLTVTVTYDYSFLVIPNFITGIGSPLILSAKTVMRCE